MSQILVSGLINVETTLRVGSFPVEYFPVRYPFWGVNTTVSGVGYNVAGALTTLGDEARLVSLLGRDALGTLSLQALAADGISTDFVLRHGAQTAQSVILYDDAGQRQIHVDLKDIQEQIYPVERFEAALTGADLAVLCNINFSRPLLQAAKQRGAPVATDVHTISDLDDPYNRDFMAAADILFMSDERLPVSPEEWARRILARYGAEIVVIGLGAEGALLALRDTGSLTRLPAVHTRKIINTIGAGDALFSAFVHLYAQTRDAYTSLQKAIVFASYKIGEKGAAQGFLTATELDAWYRRSL